MSVRSGAGVDGLQARCAMGIFGELDWSPGIHQQCIWRLDREGQKNPVTAFFLVTDDGSDPPMKDVLGIKASESQHIVDPHLGVDSKRTIPATCANWSSGTSIGKRARHDDDRDPTP